MTFEEWAKDNTVTDSIAYRITKVAWHAAQEAMRKRAAECVGEARNGTVPLDESPAVVIAVAKETIRALPIE